ncbi:Rqc2 family fibronectin-binding protein [Lyngbya confervoides]|uniref:Rqc2 homolog RqcH n=1 Tax=Lyngbya confervoides BDU141951 TaxID=1574623 RepID=A0ABD4TB65_9CYAN|nr:NFACT RNA binding domain-containing protein [Lyngbya confervoides]MCM1985380.1 NFACT family protein [Lyngbya confervoides BDU141951]
MQGVDYTTLVASCHELSQRWIPSRVEQFYQRDRYTLCMAIRTAHKRGWMEISWHPQAARIALGSPPPKHPDTFTFSDQLRHQINGLALVDLTFKRPWERVVELKFAQRPQDPIQGSLMVEVMNKYSNVVLLNADQVIVAAAHQVSAQQSRQRPVQTGQPYEMPPRQFAAQPNVNESYDHWRSQVQLIPQPLIRALIQTYQGVGSRLANRLIRAAGLQGTQSVDQLAPQDWQRLFDQWQHWLRCLAQASFTPALCADGYTVLGLEADQPMPSVSEMLQQYYGEALAVQAFERLRHQLVQAVGVRLKKLGQKADQFQRQLMAEAEADQIRDQADLLMAYLHRWQPGMATIVLQDFVTGKDRTISLDPELNAVQNAQKLYKKHQKLKRSRDYIQPLLHEVQREMAYLDQVDATIASLETYETDLDLEALQEIREELVQEGYLSLPGDRRRSSTAQTHYRSLKTPSGFTVLVGRNNQQNDHLTFKTAGSYDLWFHAQEISGSHVLLRLDAGVAVQEDDLQFCANVAAYFSRARQSDQVPVVYTQPKYVFKPKGAKPGMAIYQQEQVLWGTPQAIGDLVSSESAKQGHET